MPVYAIVGLTEPAKLKAALTENFPGDIHDVTPTTWLIASPQTTSEVSDRLKLSGGVLGPQCLEHFPT
jgi:hypothetical protein